MEAERLRIEEDLRGQIAGEVRCDAVFLELYASDASLFQVRPLGVVRPRTIQDVAATARYAAENNLALHARGAGSSLCGGALGPGLIIDFSRFFRRILAEGDDWVTVQPGVVLESLNRHLARRGRTFGPDPANRQITTLGGVIGRNSAGSRWLAYGSASRHVRRLESVLSDGTIVRLEKQALSEDDEESDSASLRLARGAASIFHRYSDAFSGHVTASALDRSGYALAASVEEGMVDLARLATGSEGTLALITEATVSTVPLPEHVGSCLLMFNSLQAAAEGAVELSTRRMRACELFDRRHLSLARELDPRYELMAPSNVEAVLLVEVEGSSPERVEDALRDVENLLVQRRQLAAGAYLATDAYDQKVLWELASEAGPRLYQLQGASRPIPLIEDIAVAPADLPVFLQRALTTFRRFQVTAAISAHAGSGQIHMRPFVDMNDASEMDRLGALAAEIYEHVTDLRGTISGSEGEGLSRTGAIERQHGALMQPFRELKSLFDPQGILNPGKKVPRLDRVVVERLRSVAYPISESQESGGGATDVPRLFDLHLDWSADAMAQAAGDCNGCAACRVQESPLRMCPIFRYAPREEATPRAKANLARALLTGNLPIDSILTEECKQIADLCVHCHMCRQECPSHIDVPKLMMELKAGFAATNGLDAPNRVLARIDSLCAWASRFPRLANWAIRNRPARWVLEKTLGIAQGRKLPRISRQPFMASSDQRRRSTALPVAKEQENELERALYFVDTFANYCDTQLAQALVAVLEHNGVKVYIPAAQQEAGMPLISQGLIDPARRIAERNVSLLAEGIRRGYSVVTTEPSAALSLRHEYLHLLADDPDAELVARSTYDACRYLWMLHQRGKLRLDFLPLDITVGYHKPCHLKVLEPGSATVDLLNLIPGLQVRAIEKGCSGIAGLYGFQRSNYRRSLRAGLPLLSEMRSGRFLAGVTDCSTCRVQMEQGVAKPTLHPVKLIALAYNLMPEIADQLYRTNEPLIVR